MKKIFAVLTILFVAAALFSGCSVKKKEMTLKDFAKIEMEINLPDPDLNPELVRTVAKKYGYTFEQYREFSNKVYSDQSIREKLGEMRLKETRGK